MERVSLSFPPSPPPPLSLSLSFFLFVSRSSCYARCQGYFPLVTSPGRTCQDERCPRCARARAHSSHDGQMVPRAEVRATKCTACELRPKATSGTRMRRFRATRRSGRVHLAVTAARPLAIRPLACLPADRRQASTSLIENKSRSTIDRWRAIGSFESYAVVSRCASTTIETRSAMADMYASRETITTILHRAESSVSRMPWKTRLEPDEPVSLPFPVYSICRATHLRKIVRFSSAICAMTSLSPSLPPSRAR